MPTVLTSAISIKQAAQRWKVVETPGGRRLLYAIVRVYAEVLLGISGLAWGRWPLGTGHQSLPFTGRGRRGSGFPMPSMPVPSKRHTCLQTDEPLLHYHLGQDMFTSEIGLKRR